MSDETKRVSLYSISTQLTSIFNELNQNAGEINDESAELLESLSSELVTKTDGVVDFIKYQSSYIDEIKKRKKELDDLEKVEKNKLDNFKKYIVTCMTILKEKKLSGKFGKITLRKPIKKLKIIDEKKIPLDFIEKIESYKILNSEITKALKNGDDITGAILIDGDQSLLIK